MASLTCWNTQLRVVAIDARRMESNDRLSLTPFRNLFASLAISVRPRRLLAAALPLVTVAYFFHVSFLCFFLRLSLTLHNWYLLQNTACPRPPPMWSDK